MKTPFRHCLITLLFLTGILCLGCNSGSNTRQSKAASVNLVFANASSNSLKGVVLKCSGRELRAGILIPNSEATILDVPWPNSTNGSVAFIDEKTGQEYDLMLSFASANERIQNKELHQVKINILSNQKAEIICE